MRKLLIAVPLIAVIAYAGTKWLVQKRTAEAVDQAIALAAPYATISYDSVSSSMTGELAITGITVIPAKYRDRATIGSTGIKLPSFLDLLKLHDIGPRSGRQAKIPDHYEVFIEDALIDSRHDYMRDALNASQEAETAKYSGQVPSREEDPVGHCAGRYGLAAEDMLELDLPATQVSLRFGVHQLEDEFSVDASVDIDDYQSYKFSGIFVGSMQSLSQGRARPPLLKSFELILDDQSAMARSYNRCEALGVDRVTAKSAMYEQLVDDLAEAGFVIDDRLAEPLRAAIEAEHTWFKVTADPATPINLNQVSLYKASDLPALFGVELETR